MWSRPIIWKKKKKFGKRWRSLLLLCRKMDLIIPHQSGSQIIDRNYHFCNDYLCTCFLRWGVSFSTGTASNETTGYSMAVLIKNSTTVKEAKRKKKSDHRKNGITIGCLAVIVRSLVRSIFFNRVGQVGLLIIFALGKISIDSALLCNSVTHWWRYNTVWIYENYTGQHIIITWTFLRFCSSHVVPEIKSRP